MNRFSHTTMLFVGLVAGIALVVGGFFAISATNRTAFGQAPDAVAEPNAPLAVSQVLSYQGRLLDPSTGAPKNDGVYEMTFSIYNVLTGGTALWTETKSVTVGGGAFTSLLGDTTPLVLGNFDGQELFLGIKVGDDAEATPRQRLAHSAYAMFAEKAGSADTATSATTAGDAGTLDGNDSADFATSSHAHDDRYFTEGESNSAFVNTAGPDAMTGNDANAILNVTQNGSGHGIEGITSATSPGKAGVYGATASVTGAGTPNGTPGVFGRSSSSFGVVGFSNTDDGVYGRSNEEYGVRAESAGSKAAIFALASGGTSTSHGVQASGYYGVSASGSSRGVSAFGPIGVYGDSSTAGGFGLYTPDRLFVGTSADLAEHMPAAVGVEAGDVVVIDPDHDERVIKSYKANDSALAGVISTYPAMLIGAMESASDTPLALAGRVPVKVSAENGAIRRGDLLTTSDTPGHAMRATPIEVNGIEFYAPGTIIGKAMEELETGTGTVIVLILPQ